MNFIFVLGHPAHFHLFKNVMGTLTARGHRISILIKEKDVLGRLLRGSGLAFHNILPGGRKNSLAGAGLGVVQKGVRLLAHCLKNRPDLLIGTSVEISHVGKILGIPSVNVNEDDAAVVPLYARLGYPLADVILSPRSCHNGRWEDKSVKYAGYHELAYLHPNHFQPDRSALGDGFPTNRPYFLLRLAKLTAHHDGGIGGIDDTLALKIIDTLAPHGQVLISSEREMSPSLARHRIRIDPLNMHHAIYFAKAMVSDSQTMSAEAAVLGTPFVRCNDFVGRIGYLNELETTYRLGHGIRPGKAARLVAVLIHLLRYPDLDHTYQRRRRQMLADSIDVTAFMVWFFENFPDSLGVVRQRPDYPMRFN